MIHASSILFSWYCWQLLPSANLPPISCALPYRALLVVIVFIGSEVETRLMGLDTGIHWHNLKTIIIYGLDQKSSNGITRQCINGR